MTERDQFEIPKDMRSMAETGFGQAKQAMETFLNAAHQAASTMEERGAAARANVREVSAKALAFAEKNVTESLDYAQKLARAKDVGEVLKLHSEYVQAQMKALADQASELGQAISRAAMDMTKPK